MTTVYLLLGSNEGDRMGWLNKALQLLEERCGAISKFSAVYRTAAWGLEDQPDFLNMAVELETDQTATELLESVQGIEHELGRQRTVKWGQRTLDIDILFFGNEVIDIPALKVPHPFLPGRRFALVPLAEIAPAFTHPVLDKSVEQLLRECPDTLTVTLMQ